MVRQICTVCACSPTSANSRLPKAASVLSNPVTPANRADSVTWDRRSVADSRVVSTTSYTAVPSAGRNAVAAVRGVVKPIVFQAKVAPPISAPIRASTSSGGHQGRSGRGGAQDGSTAKYANGSSGSVLQSCTGNGDHGWSSARDTGLILSKSKGGRPPLNPPRPADDTRAPAPHQQARGDDPP